jgi:ribose/xylose/arabinose/galactoside ABC-type transport system permease subunit
MKRFIAKHSPLFILAALCMLLAVYSPGFRGMDNIQSVMQRTSVIGIIAIGQLLVILTAGIDLSVGSVAAFSGAAACLSMKEWGFPVPFGIMTGMAAGLLCGTVNGTLVTKGRIPPFIVTLGMMMAARGLTLIITGGQPIFGLPPGFAWIGGTKMVEGVAVWYVPVIITVMLALVFAIMLNFTRFGRALYAIGGNLQAARLSGIPVDRERIKAFALSGLMAGFAGVMLASRTSVATPNAAEMYELDAIAACVIGGASLMGGEGSAIAAVAGALIMMVLRNFCNLENIDVYWQQVLVGALIVALVFYDNFRKRKAGLIQE